MIKVWSTYPPAIYQVPISGAYRLTGGTVHRIEVDGVNVSIDADLPEGIDLGWFAWQRPEAVPPAPKQSRQVHGSTGKMYTITRQANGSWSCTCPGYQYRRFCKHTGAK